nr:NAD(P)H-binding protein [Rhodococcus sp. (in: high G+C Gram-positive bacteria)]
MITVIGATGHVGGNLARTLLDNGQDVRAIGRNPHALAALSARGADTHSFDLTDTPRLADTLVGSETVFAMVPSDPFTEHYDAHQQILGESICSAIASSGVPTVVALSSLGADREDAPGVIGSLHRQEQRLRAIHGVRVMALRPVSFFENLLAAVDQIMEDGNHVDSILPDLPIPMIAAADVADAAATAFADAGWNGFSTRDLLGERDLSYIEATRILGGALGFEGATYTPLPDDAMAAALIASGMSGEYARQYVAMTRAFNSGELTDPVPRTPANSTPTTFEAFAASLVAAGQPS